MLYALCCLLALASHCLVTVHAECLPMDYDIGDTLLTTSTIPTTKVTVTEYCADKHDGGGTQKCGDWFWDINTECYPGGGERCKCVTTSCFGGCTCHMKDHSDIQYCFLETKKCANAPRGYYLIGCGCFFCPHTVYYNWYLYNFVYGAECNPSSYGWACGSGSHLVCPVGYKCYGGLDYPIPCPADTYQNATGQTVCLPCECPVNTYKPTNDTWRCGNDKPLDGHCIPCSVCTPEGDKPGKGPYNRCSDQNWNFGFNAQKACVPCDECPPDTYSGLNSTDSFCLTDKSICKLRYYDNADIALFANVAQLPQNDLVNRAREGTMPFKLGLHRNKGTPLSPGPSKQTGLRLPGRPEIFPYYTKCQISMQNANVRTEPLSLGVQNQMNARDWAFDCDASLIAECDKEKYAVLATASAVTGLTYLVECRPCPYASSGGGGRLTECTCRDGFASISNLENSLTTTVSSSHVTNSLCLNCASQVLIKDYQNAYQIEAVQCVSNATGGIKRCTGRSFVNSTFMCTACPNNTIPLHNRSGCFSCGPGQKIMKIEQDDYYYCKDCDVYQFHEYQDQFNQLTCKSKNMTCAKGQQLLPNNNNWENNKCIPCRGNDCASNEIKIMLANAQAGNDTCDGLGHNYYGCYPMDKDVAPTLAPNIRFAYVVSQDTLLLENAHLATETCNERLKPADASWVRYDSGADGKQCYFACDYGVHSTNGPALHLATEAYVKQFRKDLLPFLPTPKLAAATTGLKIQQVVTWGYVEALRVNLNSDNTRIENWVLRVNKDVDSSSITAMSTNTFLFLEEMLTKTASQPICLSASSGTSLAGAHQCPTGFGRSAMASSTPKCALQARTNMYKVNIILQNTPPIVTINNNNSSNNDNNNTQQQQQPNNNTNNNGSSSSSSLSSSSTVVAYYVACADMPGGTLSCPVSCRADNEELTSFELPCTDNHLNIRYNAALSLEQDQDAFSAWSNRLKWIRTYLKATTWMTNRLKFNPYIPGDSSDTTCALQTFRYGLNAHMINSPQGSSIPQDWTGTPGGIQDTYACIPCDQGANLCKEAYMPNPRFFNEIACTTLSPPYPFTEHSARNLCIPCELTKPHAVLILGDELNVAGDPATVWEHWWTLRHGGDTYSQYFSSLSWNTDVQCRYRCSPGFTSNNLGPDAYNLNPCLSCNASVTTLRGSCAENKAVYVSPGSIAMSGSACSKSTDDYIPFMPRCEACENAELSFNGTVSQLIFKATPNPALTSSECLAMCEPNTYHTIIAHDKSIATDFITVQNLYGCQDCKERPDLACNGSCVPGRYRHNVSGLCVPCNMMTCPNLNEYREQCSGHTDHDAQCLPCQSSALYNPTQLQQPLPPTISSTLFNDITSLLQTTKTRQWVSDPQVGRSVSNNGKCLIACINNYVWVDPFNSGLFPSFSSNANTSHLYCIPCESTFIRQALPSPADHHPILYSVWNSTNTTIEGTIPPSLAGTALRSMEGYKGACNFCPDFYVTRDYGSSIMCESIPGHTTHGQGPAGTENVYSPADNNTQTSVGGTNSSQGWTDISGGRRRRSLLQTNAALMPQQQGGQIITIQVRIQPLVLISTSYFACCDALDTETQQKQCRRLVNRTLESKKTSPGAQYGNMFCTKKTDVAVVVAPPPTRRRQLLSTATTNIQGCLSGNFKQEWGDGPCNTCPNGASTRWDQSTSRSECQCLPGFRADRDPQTGTLRECVPCGWQMHRPPSLQNDSVCLPCPPNQFTPTETSSYCYCKDGTYLTPNNTCDLCEPGFYCTAQTNERISCPPNSYSPAGASTQGQCKCNGPAYYGDLFLGTQCFYSHPALNCTTTPNSILCPCAFGWKMTPEGECVSSCNPGEYAILLSDGHSIQNCVPCPPDTYTSTNTTVYIPQLPLSQQCTQCPPGRHTTSRERGGASLAACSCLFGGFLSSTSTNVSSLGACQTCAAGQYLDPTQQICQPCPAGTTSPSSSVGLNSCLCPKGSMLFRQTLTCEPCPLGYYSNSIGASCTPCGSSMTTAVRGATSRLQCKDGYSSSNK